MSPEREAAIQAAVDQHIKMEKEAACWRDLCVGLHHYELDPDGAIAQAVVHLLRLAVECGQSRISWPTR